MLSSWHPLLQGNLAARALKAVDAIASALPEAPIETPIAVGPEGAIAWPGEYDLINGLVGLGIYALERGIPRRRG